MRVRNYKLALAVSTLLAGGPVSAQIDLDGILSTESGSETPVMWIDNLRIDDGSTPMIPAIGGTGGHDLYLSKQFGFGWTAGGTVYIRFDLSDGAVFTGEATAESSSTDVDCTSRRPMTNKSAAYFSCTISTVNADPEDTIILKLPADKGYKLLSKSKQLKVSYAMHEDASSSDANLAALVRVQDIPFIDFVPSYTLKRESTITATSDVAADFLKFKDDKTVAAIGHITYDVYEDASSNSAAGTIPLTSSDYAATTSVTNVPVELELVLKGTTSLTINGDFTSVQDLSGVEPQGTYVSATSLVFLSAADDCSSSAFTAKSVTAESAVFEVGTSSYDSHYVCMKPNGVSTIESSIYSATLNPVALSTRFEVAPITVGNIGRIIKNGTVLDTPYMTSAPGYISRVILTNTGTLDAPYKVVLITDEGATAAPGEAAEGIIPKGANLQINVPNLVTFSGKTRGAARFNISAPNNTIQGVYQTVTMSSGDVQSILMMRQGGGDGQDTEAAE